MSICKPLRRDVLANPWKGVNLGGWLLLEPGPAYPLFSNYPISKDEEARCEWDFMVALNKSKGKKIAAEIMNHHRDNHITKRDFEKIRDCGLNAVRIPLGYWIVMGPTNGDPYHGPALDYVDRAVNWAEACGLQVVLDLHGCPGGESGEAPCGRRQRPHGTWKWRQWRFNQSLEAVRILAERYRSRKCVTGIAVCNEPSPEIPQTVLCRYYDRAVRVVREAGMSPNHVAVLLPVFQRDEDQFIQCWFSRTGGVHRNICFDVHCYHCFENEFNGKTLAQHLRFTGENAAMLRKYPMVVGEWSLALGCTTWNTCGKLKEESVYNIFGCTQLEAFREASHGSFFWNWSERDDVEWNFQKAYAQGCFTGKPRRLPPWDGHFLDPLEKEIDGSVLKSCVSAGDVVFLRVFHGRYVDVQGSSVQARWPEKGDWQSFAIFHAASCQASNEGKQRRLRNGDVVLIQTHNRKFLSVKGDDVVATRSPNSVACEFILRIHDIPNLKHYANISLQSRLTSMMLDADADDESIAARYDDLGEWQKFVVEKNKDGKTVTMASSVSVRKRPASLSTSSPIACKKMKMNR